MQYTYPQFLWALLALAIPIIIHLFRFRRYKKLMFPNVRFLKEIKEDTSANRKLKHLLVLASRLLALAALVFAFAKPFIPVGDDVIAGKKAVSVFVDNSFSMKSLSQDVPLIDKAKTQAREIINAYAPDDAFQVLTNDLEGRHQRIVSREEALNYIDEIEVSPVVRPLQLIVERMKQTLNRSEASQKITYLISDFQNSIADFDEIQDTSYQYNLVPIRSVQQNNVTIDSAWLQSPVQMVGQTNTCLLQIKNYGESTAESVQITYTSNGQTKPVGTVTIPAQGTIIDTFKLPVLEAGWQTGEFSINDYPIQFDDKMFIAFKVEATQKVLIINDRQENIFLKSAYSGAPNFETSTAKLTNLTFSDFDKNNLIILNEPTEISSGLATELEKYLQNGGNIIFFPSARGNLNSYNALLGQLNMGNLQAFENAPNEVSRINENDYIFEDVFKKVSNRLLLPKVKGYFPMTPNQGAGIPLLQYRDGKTFLHKERVGNGQFFLCTAPLDKAYSDFVNNAAIFVPFLFKSAILKGQKPKIARFIGSQDVVEIPHSPNNTRNVYKLKSADDEFIPQQTFSGSKVLMSAGNSLNLPGLYRVVDAVDSAVYQLAYNYDRRESNLSLMNDEALANLSSFNVLTAANQQNIGQTIGERSQGKQLWRKFLIAALIFLIVEVLLLRFWRT